jgi:hypothetical protein
MASWSGTNGGRKNVLPRDHARGEVATSAYLRTWTWPAGGAPAARRRVASSLRQLCVAAPVADELASDEEAGGTPGRGNTVGSNALADTADRTLDDGKLAVEACACWPWGVFLQ